MTPELDTQNLVALFDALAPIAEPAAIPMAPQTAAWWVLAALILLGLGAGGVAWRRRHVANAYRRAALAALDASGEDPAAIATVLRRTALAAFPRAHVAGLTGTDWLAFLDQTAPGTGLSASPEGQTLITAPFRATAKAPGLRAKARHWIKAHKGARA